MSPRADTALTVQRTETSLPVADQLNRRIDSRSRSQIGARLRGGAVATPSRSPESALSGDAYQAESGDGDIPNVNASRATATSDVPFGNFSSTARPGAAR